MVSFNCEATPKCNRTQMIEFGCRVSGLPFHWCPSCGTLRTCDGQWSSPASVVMEGERGEEAQLRRTVPSDSGVTGEQSADTGYDKRLPTASGSAVRVSGLSDAVLPEAPWIAVPPLTGEWLPDHLG